MKSLRDIYCSAVLFVIIAAITSLPAFAADGFTCNFPNGIFHTFENSVFQTGEAKSLSFEIGDIDLSAQTASLVTPRGKGSLKIVRAIGANHYLEVIAEGYLNITTIYDADIAGGPFPAVHSRHFGLLGTPVVSQYLGVCKAS